MATWVPTVTTPAALLQIPRGWDPTLRPTVIRTLDPSLVSRVTVEAFEWNDFAGLGIGSTAQNLTGALTQVRARIQAGGSDLYAYALLHKIDFNVTVPGWVPFIGGQSLARVDRYRLILLHSAVPLLAIGVGDLIALAVFLTVIAVAIQYITTGQSPLLADLGKFWKGLIQQAVAPIGPAVSGVIVWPFLVGGVLLLGYAVASKELGVQPKPPQTKVGVGLSRGPVSAQVGGGT